MIRIHLLGTMNIHGTLDGKPSISFGVTLSWIKALVNWKCDPDIGGESTKSLRILLLGPREYMSTCS